jgi:hypothetical protein
MIIYSNLIKLFKHCGNYILFKLIMNIHEYSEYLDYFFDTLHGHGGISWTRTREFGNINWARAIAGLRIHFLFILLDASEYNFVAPLHLAACTVHIKLVPYHSHHY